MPGLNSQTSTILLLIVLGYLIYTMCTPNQTDNFENVTVAPNTKPKTVQFNIPQPVNINQQLVDSAVRPPGYVAPTIVPPSVYELTEEPTEAPTKTPPKCSSSVSDFDSTTGGSFADLDKAFEPNSELELKPNCSAVSLNKKNNSEYNAKDYLPNEFNSTWFDVEHADTRYTLNEDTLINTDKYIIGVNTVGQSLKNASYDIRGTIANPKFSVSPWNNSTYEPDYNLKSLC